MAPNILPLALDSQLGVRQNAWNGWTILWPPDNKRCRELLGDPWHLTAKVAKGGGKAVVMVDIEPVRIKETVFVNAHSLHEDVYHISGSLSLIYMKYYAITPYSNAKQWIYFTSFNFLDIIFY